MTPPSVHIRLLGGFALAVDGAPVTLASARVQAALACLALAGDAPLPRRRLAYLLWPDSTDPQAQTNLRTLLHRLSAAVPDAERLLQVTPHSLAWRPGVALSLDVAEFAGALDVAEAAERGGDPDGALAAYRRAVVAYAGDLLPECYDEWTLPERERLRGRLLGALGRLVALLEERRAYDEAAEHARRLLALDPLSEGACLALVRLQVTRGDRGAALREYHAFAARLGAELGCAPGEALRDAYERLLARDQPPSGPPDAECLVGREAEWRALLAAWQAVLAGRPQLVAITGEAGIGKSRLAEELLRWAARQGAGTAEAHCYAVGGELAYAPIVAWLRSDALRPGLVRIEPLWQSEVARLAPELLPAHAPAASPAAPGQRRRLFEALAEVVRAAGRPLALLLDDAQWCDCETLDWLHFLLRSGERAALLVLATVRAEELDEANPAAQLIAALTRAGRASEIALGPLDPGETAVLAGQVAGRALSPDEAGQVYARSEGNPLFVVELARAGEVFADRREVGATALPPAVRAVIGGRLMQASPPARELLRVAAVIGRSFTLGVLARAADAREDGLARALDELWQRRIVRARGADAYDFAHDLLRAAVYASLSPARLRLLHRRVAEALEAEHAASLAPVIAQVAAHYDRAGMPERAAPLYARAAEAAQRVYANADALAHMRRAIALGGAAGDAERARMQELLGDLLLLAGQHEEARHAWRHALADTAEDDWRALSNLHRKLGNAYRDQRRYEEARRAYAAADGLLPEVVGAPDHTTTPAWVQVQLERVSLHYWLGEVGEMLRLVERVRPVLDAVGDAAQRARLHQISAIAILRRDRYTPSDEALGHVGAYLAYAQESDPAAIPAARFQLGFALLWASRLDQAEQEFRAALDLAERSGDVSLEARCLTYLAVARRMHGAGDEVRALAERGLRVAEAGHMPDYLGAARGNLAWLAWRAGDLDSVASHTDAAFEAWRALPSPYMFEWLARWPRIAHDLARGDVVGAGLHARALAAESQQRPPPELEPLLAAAARAAQSGDFEVARTNLEAARGPAQALGYL